MKKAFIFSFLFTFINLSGFTMHKELEIKFFIEKEQFIEKLIDQNAVKKQSQILMRRQIFTCLNATHPEIEQWLRVRDEGHRITATLKQKSNETIHGVRECEVIVNDFNTTCTMMELLGFNPRSYQENYRETWELDDCSICIDEWPALKSLVEIEGPSEECVLATAAKLGFDPAIGIYGTIDQLYEKAHEISKKTFNQIKKLTFENAEDLLRSLKKKQE